MLIPQFKLQQTDQFIVVVIRVPYIKVSACEFYIEEEMFKFFLKPYLLSLSFQQPLKQCEEPAKAVYYHEKHLLEVSLLKKNKGQFFQNLNLLSNIISKKEDKKKKEKKVLVEVIGETEHKVLQDKEKTISPYAYGFCYNYTKVFKDLQEQVYELFSFNPENTLSQERYELNRKIVFEEFDENSYLFDKISNFQQIDRIVENQAADEFLIKGIKQIQSKEPASFEKFKQSLKIPTKQLIYHKEDAPVILKQIISLTISYIYELCCMEGQMGVESAKTMNLSSGVLSCFLGYERQQTKEVVIDSVRRCIVFSLYKHIDIGNKVVQFLSKNLCSSLLLFIFADLRTMLEKSDPRYLLNRIFIDDFCVYLMTTKIEEQLRQIKKSLKDVKISEEELELDIDTKEQLEISNMGESNGNTLGLELEQMLQFD